MSGFGVRDLKNEVAKLTTEMQILNATRNVKDEMLSGPSVSSWGGAGNPQQLSVVHVPVPVPVPGYGTSQSQVQQQPLQPQQPAYSEVHQGYTTLPNTTLLQSHSLDTQPHGSVQQFSTTIPKYHIPGQPLTVIGLDGRPFNVTPPMLPPGSQFLVQPPPAPPSTPAYPVVVATSEQQAHPSAQSIPATYSGNNRPSRHREVYESKGSAMSSSSRDSVGPVVPLEEYNNLRMEKDALEASIASNKQNTREVYSIPSRSVEKVYFSISAPNTVDPVVVHIYDDQKMRVLLSYVGDERGVLCDERNQVIDLNRTPRDLRLDSDKLVELKYFGGSSRSRSINSFPIGSVPTAPELGSPKSNSAQPRRPSLGSPKSRPRTTISPKHPNPVTPRHRPRTRGLKSPTNRPVVRSRSNSPSRRRGASPKTRHPPPTKRPHKSVTFG